MASSAFISTPPANDRDLLIAIGMLLDAGITAGMRDPSEGVAMRPSRPDDYIFETKAPGIIAGSAICIFVMLLVTSTRFLLRIYLPRLKWGLDDTLLVPGVVMAIAYSALQVAMALKGGAGKHIFDITYLEYYHYKWYANIAQIGYVSDPWVLPILRPPSPESPRAIRVAETNLCQRQHIDTKLTKSQSSLFHADNESQFMCVGVIKMSIAASNTRLTSIKAPAFKFANWIIFGLCAMYTLASFFTIIFQCDPPGSSFDLLIIARSGKPPQCLGFASMDTILRAVNIGLNCCLLATPIIIVCHIHMSRSKRVRIFILFGVGALAFVGSVMTLVSQIHLKDDVLWNYTGVLGWSLAELTVGVVTVSLPTLAFLLPRSTTATSRSGCAEVHVVHSYQDKYLPKNRSNTVLVNVIRYGPSPDLVDVRDPKAIYCTAEVELHRKSMSACSESQTPLTAVTRSMARRALETGPRSLTRSSSSL